MTARVARELLYERTYYLPRYLVDDKWRDSTGECSLFVRRFRLYRTRKLRLEITTDVWTYPNAEAMVEAIEHSHLRPLPAEAEADRLYLPGGLSRHEATAAWSPSGVPQPELVA
jgi:hypothetical protein